MERMRAGERRALSEGETAILAAMFAGAFDPAKLRIFQAPPIGFAAMVPIGRTIVFSHWRAARDFAIAPLAERGWLVHEAMHCAQARGGIVLAYAKLRALGRRAYRYDLAPDKPLAAYNIEQQAEIARHLFLARCNAPDPLAPPRDLLEALWPFGA